jgi:hypothetical protein
MLTWCGVCALYVSQRFCRAARRRYLLNKRVFDRIERERPRHEAANKIKRSIKNVSTHTNYTSPVAAQLLLTGNPFHITPTAFN